MKITLLIIFVLTVSISPTNATLVNDKPDDIVDLRTYLPKIKMDIRYFSKRNFIGEEIRGYISPKCLLQEHVAKDLALVQENLKTKNLELIIYDCYRPQVAVNHFVDWANNLEDIKMKNIFYPNVSKNDLFKLGYIAAKSGHSKGNTIDLGLIVLGSNINEITSKNLESCLKPLTREHTDLGLIEMGTSFDCFDELSHTDNSRISSKARFNRDILVDVMKKHGFKNYSKEWWHFSHQVNNYPSTYHEFFVE